MIIHLFIPVKGPLITISKIVKENVNASHPPVPSGNFKQLVKTVILFVH